MSVATKSDLVKLLTWLSEMEHERLTVTSSFHIVDISAADGIESVDDCRDQRTVVGCVEVSSREEKQYAFEVSS